MWNRKLDDIKGLMRQDNGKDGLMMKDDYSDQNEKNIEISIKKYYNING